MLTILFLFFLLRLRPTRSTLFPYTTLFRSCRLRKSLPDRARCSQRGVIPCGRCRCTCTLRIRWHRRSEEHTSELQSHSDLVCRLLLEKKKTKADRSPISQRR